MNRFGTVGFRLGAAIFILLFLIVWPSNAAGESPIVITEILYSAIGEDDFEEWFEIANIGPTAVDISGYAIGDEEVVGQNEGMVRFPAGTILEPGQAVVIAKSADAFEARYGISPDFELIGDSPVPNLEPALDLAQGEIRLSNGGDHLLLLDANDVRIDLISYGDRAEFLNPPLPNVQKGQSLERNPANCDTDSAADWITQEFPTPGRIATDPNCEIVLDSGGSSDSGEVAGLPIGEIQGNIGRSPYTARSIEATGIVIGTHADRNSAGRTFYTVYMQSPIGAEDGDPTTSDGLPVFFGTEEPRFRVGDEIFVTGRITEYYGLTEVEDDGRTVQLLSRDNPVPAPTEYDPTIGREAQEALESTFVTLEEAIAIAPTYNTGASCGFTVMRLSDYEAFGDVIITDYDQPFPPTVPVLHLDEPNCDTFPQIKAGDVIRGLSGPLTYNFELFRIINQDPAGLSITPAEFPEVPNAPDLQPGEISVTTFNVENFFDGIDDTGDDSEPKLTPAEIATKQAKIAYALGGMLDCPTIIGIQEVEKASLLVDLAAELNGYCGFTYDVTHFESLDGRGIDNGLLTDPNRVAVDSAELLPTCSEVITDVTGFDCPAGEYPLFSRPPLKASLTIDGQSELVVYVNHFKSKRGGDVETLLRRKRQAEFVRSDVETLGGQAAIVLGDFNDYANTSPMQVFAEDGFLTNVLHDVPEGEDYSFNFGGIRQLIDGILLTEDLVAKKTAVQIFHVNADYPDALTEDLSPERIAFKSSDHDPALVVLQLGEEGVTPQETGEPIETPVPEVPDSPTTSTGIGGWLTMGVAGILMAIAGWLTFRPRPDRGRDE